MQDFALIKTYHKMGLKIRKCPCCYAFASTEYNPGKSFRIHCPCGCGVVTEDNTQQKLKEDQLIRKTIERWNRCEYDE